MIEAVEWGIFAAVVIFFFCMGNWVERRIKLMGLRKIRKTKREKHYFDQLISRSGLNYLKNKLLIAEMERRPFSYFLSLTEKIQHDYHIKIFLLPTTTSLKVEVYIRSHKHPQREFHIRSWEFHPWNK